ncbi:unnamed protein product [Durusdinium trenchii]|uniref:Uncharacterized protein n=1 Tax=Durusdinium trenchii TaxID=1381693 RepID=A0ABP0P3N8_9DINO
MKAALAWASVPCTESLLLRGRRPAEVIHHRCRIFDKAGMQTQVAASCVMSDCQANRLDIFPSMLEEGWWPIQSEFTERSQKISTVNMVFGNLYRRRSAGTSEDVDLV